MARLKIHLHGDAAPRRTRASLGYMESADPRFAECAGCRDYHPAARRCRILGPDFPVDPENTCIEYVRGPRDLDDAPQRLVTPQEVNFSRSRPRCENCVSFGAYDTCTFFERLNSLAPALFDLDNAVAPRGCCNAQVNKGE